jgi:hypothetical protein
MPYLKVWSQDQDLGLSYATICVSGVPMPPLQLAAFFILKCLGGGVTRDTRQQGRHLKVTSLIPRPRPLSRLVCGLVFLVCLAPKLF